MNYLIQYWQKVKNWSCKISALALTMHYPECAGLRRNQSNICFLCPKIILWSMMSIVFSEIPYLRFLAISIICLVSINISYKSFKQHNRIDFLKNDLIHIFLVGSCTWQSRDIIIFIPAAIDIETLSTPVKLWFMWNDIWFK